MNKPLLTACALAGILGASAPVQAENVTTIKLDSSSKKEISGDIKSGKKIPLKWAENSAVACFPATRFEMFDGNHVFYNVTLPAKKKIDIKLVPTDKSKVINLYALRQGVGKQAVPPNVTSAISSEARYPMYARKGGKIIKNADDGIRKIDFISVNRPYNILIGVAGAKGATEGGFKLSVAVKDRN